MCIIIGNISRRNGTADSNRPFGNNVYIAISCRDIKKLNIVRILKVKAFRRALNGIEVIIARGKRSGCRSIQNKRLCDNLATVLRHITFQRQRLRVYRSGPLCKIFSDGDILRSGSDYSTNSGIALIYITCHLKTRTSI